ncbi:MAG TPA: VOC family protein, partial [Dehalococcoidia bacterium]|nr:VOC family protein [Dehalococcoidia bacterium]
MLKIATMDHIVLNVSDIDRSLHFYGDILGLTPERVAEYRAGEVGFPSVRINEHTIIDLFPPERQTKVIGEGFAENLNHLCLCADNEDMDAVAEYLKAHGLEIETGPIQRWGARGAGTSVYFRDPDRNLVEVRTYAPAAAKPAAPAASGAVR